jgi:hypothetical protein
MVFDADKKEEIEIELKRFVAEEKMTVLDTILGSNNVSILLPTDKLVETVQSLYSYFHKDSFTKSSVV